MVDQGLEVVELFFYELYITKISKIFKTTIFSIQSLNFRLSEACLEMLSTCGTLKESGKVPDLKIHDLIRVLLVLHYAYIEGIAYRCFSDVDIG